MAASPVSPDGYDRIKRNLFDPLEASQSSLPRLGKYVLIRELGRGGMGIVFEAGDPELRRRVAVKILKQEDADPGVIERFHREAEIAAQLKHPNIVAIHEFGSAGDGAGRTTHFIAMDFVEGRTLAEVMSEGKTNRRELLRMLEDVGRAVDFAHSKGVVHRDLKPGNVLVETTGRVLLTDFGLARADRFSTLLTRSQAVIGTPQYMAPEQVEGKVRQIGPRTDVYALGVMLYEVLTGRTPFAGKTPVKLYDQILRDEPRRPSRWGREIAQDLEVICLRAMEKREEHRYATAQDFAEDLRRFREGEPIQAQPISTWRSLAKKARRHRPLVAVASALVVVIAGVSVWAIVTAVKHRRRLAAEQSRADRRERTLQELGGLWTDIVVAKQGFHNASEDPHRVRAKIQEGIDRVTAFIGRHPDIPQAHYVRARGQLYLGQWKQAEETIRRAIELDASFAPAHALLGQVLLEHYYYAQIWDVRSGGEQERKSKALLLEARQELSLAGGASLERWGLTRTREDEVAEVLMQALTIAFLNEDLAGAGRILLEADQREPSEQYRNWLGDWHESLDGNIAWQTEALRCMSHYARAYVHRASARGKKDDLDGALADYSKAIAIDPECVHAYNNRGYVRYRKGDRSGALSDYTQAIQVDPGFDGAYYNRGSLRLEMREFDDALSDLTRAIELSPRNPDAYSQRGTVYRDLRDDEKAVEDYKKAIEIEPEHVAAWANRGVAHEIQKRFPEAARDYLEALRIAGPAWSLRGEIEKRLQKVRPR